MTVPDPALKGLTEILDLLRTGTALTRADITEITGRGRSTVAARLEQLQAAGLVDATGRAASTGGRPPTVFAFSPSARIVVAIDLGATHAQVAITDLAGNVLASRRESMSIGDGPDIILDAVTTISIGLISEAGRELSDIAGIGIGVPGPIDHSTGRPTNPPIMPGWDDADIRGRLTRALSPSPVLVDNDVNLMALGEHALAYPTVDHLLFVKVATGIGAGSISGGRILRGADGAAGDIGHIAVLGDTEVVCRCGNTGCLEAIAGSAGIIREFKKFGLNAESSADIVALVRAGDPQASRILRTAGRHIGQVLAACVSMLNPSVIVIGGRLADSGEHLLAGIRETIYGRSLPLATQNLRIVTSRTAGNAGVSGAAAMVIDYLLSDQGLTNLL